LIKLLNTHAQARTLTGTLCSHASSITLAWMCYAVFPYLLASHSVAGAPAESLLAYCSVKQSISYFLSSLIPSPPHISPTFNKTHVSNESYGPGSLSPSTYPFFLLLHSSHNIHLLCDMVICSLRGGESVTCRLAPSSYDTRWHSTAVRALTRPGSDDQIIFLTAFISHIPMCHPDNRSHTIRTKPMK